MNLKITKRETLKEKPDYNNLTFGKNFTDHMFIMNYEKGKGWFDGRIVPYQNIEIDPSSMVFHYGQETFEGLKAYKNEKGDISLFRPRDNFERLNRSNERLCMPPIDVDYAVYALKELLKIEKDWIPTSIGMSLYIRPFIIATEEALGVKSSDKYLFIIILSPVGAYYKNGISPTSIYVEDFYARASFGGTGEAKCGGNYAASIKPYIEAKEKGFDQVLFLDSNEHKYIEEIGTSNAFFVIDNEVITPPLKGTILPGITRDSMINVLKNNGYIVSERKITIDEVFEAHKNGKLSESFATGTAAVISPIGKLTYKENEIVINNNEIGEVAKFLYDSLTGIQHGVKEDPFNWVVHV